MGRIAEKDKCPRCKGENIIQWYKEGPWITCTSCGGCGLSSKARKERASKNLERDWAVYNKEKERSLEVSIWADSFKPLTNLDHVALEYVKKELRSDLIRLNHIKPRKEICKNAKKTYKSH